MNSGEHDRLLQTDFDEQVGAPVGVPEGKDPSKCGPMDIARSTRYGILAGIWVATFLSVCNAT